MRVPKNPERFRHVSSRDVAIAACVVDQDPAEDDTLSSRLRENSMLPLLLGGAAVYRCDKRLVFRGGFSR
jgi:hypothetical protein